jgi:hypothetical protein
MAARDLPVRRPPVSTDILVALGALLKWETHVFKEEDTYTGAGGVQFYRMSAAVAQRRRFQAVDKAELMDRVLTDRDRRGGQRFEVYNSDSLDFTNVWIRAIHKADR